MDYDTTNGGMAETKTTMPNLKWFSSLTKERRDAALRSTTLWLMSQNEEKMQLHLAPHKGDTMLKPADLDKADEPIREILEKFPVELHGALVAISEATTVSLLNRLQAALEQTCPDDFRTAKTKHELALPYLDGAIERHMMSHSHLRDELWGNAMASAGSDEALQALATLWRKLARNEYLSRSLKAHVRYAY